MSQIADIPFSANPTYSSVFRRYREALVRAFHHAAEEWLMRRAIAELQGLEYRMLRDIGLTRNEIESCVRHGQRSSIATDQMLPDSPRGQLMR